MTVGSYRQIHQIRNPSGFSQLNWSAQEKRGQTTGSHQRKKRLAHGFEAMLVSFTATQAGLTQCSLPPLPPCMGVGSIA